MYLGWNVSLNQNPLTKELYLKMGKDEVKDGEVILEFVKIWLITKGQMEV